VPTIGFMERLIFRRAFRIPGPDELRDVAQKAIGDDIDQYFITLGAKSFRNAIRDHDWRHYDITLGLEEGITVCCGSTEGMVAIVLAVLTAGALIRKNYACLSTRGPEGSCQHARQPHQARVPPR